MEYRGKGLYSLVNDVEVEQVGLIYYDERKDRHTSRTE